VFLGEDLLPWLLLAIGAALMVGNVLALVRPPDKAREATLDGAAPARPPLARTLTMAAIGAVAAVWALASLVR
jgi:hypothetical protein